MNVGQSVNMNDTIPLIDEPILNLEDEFINHLATAEGAEFAIRDGVSQEVLYAPKNRAIYSFVQGYYNETGQVPTPVVLKTEFNINVSKPDTSVHWVVQKLRERYQQNEVQELAFALAEKVHEPADAMNLLRIKTMEIERNSLSQRHIWSAGDSKHFLSGLQDKILSGFYQGLPIGFNTVDQFTGGLKKSYLAFMVARPKRMKTFFICNAFIQQKMAGYKPMLVTMENTEEEIMLRISCLLSGFPWDKAQRGEIDDKGWKLLENAWNEFDSLGEHWIMRPPDDERTVPQIVLQADKLGAESLILSQFAYLHPVNSHYYSRPDHEKWGSIVMDLKSAATRQGSERPILVEAQVNREGDNLEEFSDMSLAQLGLTDRIGQVSDIVFALYQNKEMRESQQVQFGIIEARNSDKSKWNVHTEFRNATYLELL